MTIRRTVVSVTTEYGGDAEVYSSRLSGNLVSIHYIKDDFASGVDFVLTSETSGETLWAEENVNASAIRYPRVATHTGAGAAANYDASAHGVLSKINLSQERVKIVVADGGNETSGVFHFTVDS